MGLRSLVPLALSSATILLGPARAGAEPPAPDAADATVSTYAGSGLAGFRDGPATQAEFLEPVGLALGHGGAVYVADAAAQRIRLIDAKGVVSTVAGSGSVDGTHLHVPGGYRDGPVASAQFDEPSGVALAPDGALLVADRRNHCIRRIADGVVTTYAGRADAPGNADGPLDAARFYQPMSLTFDSAGNLFVADFGSGVRRIDPAGHVTTFPLPYGRGLLATSVAVSIEARHEILLIALQTGIVRLDLTAQQTSVYAGGTPPIEGLADTPDHVYIDARRDLGTAYAIVPLSEFRFIYTDLQNHALRVIWSRRTRVLAGDGENAPFAAGTFRDGQGTVAHFDDPRGLLRTGTDRFILADAGNRRIRLVVVRLPPEDSIDDLAAAAKRFYRIAYAGNSYVDFDGDTQGTIAALIERGLNARAGELGLRLPARLFTVKLIADAPAIGSYIRNYFAGAADIVVWQLNSAELSSFVGSHGTDLGLPLGPQAAVWQPALEAELRATRDALAADHTKLLVVLNPMPWEVSPAESVYMQLYDLHLAPFEDTVRDGELIRQSLARSGVAALDLFPAFRAAELEAEHAALFGTVDHHYSTSGRELVAHAIVGELARAKPWHH